MNATDTLRAVDIAHRFCQLGQTKEACNAYALALHQLEDTDAHPELELEAALYIFQNGGDYKIAYSTLCALYNRGYDREELLPFLSGAFYEPNLRELKNRYARNCKLLSKYPYLFRKDFLPFEALPIAFFPFSDKGYVPYDRAADRFGDYVDLNYPQVTHYFFKDLEKPILAHDIYSAYELRYLADNVRRSDWVGKENHIYLHYSSWDVFCAYLQVWNLRPILAEKKVVFLIEDEVAQYPIDFKERFGIDYSQYPVKPIQIREVNRLIWHTQLSAHNGGDFFNEIFDGHPNLIALPSLMLDDTEKAVENVRASLRTDTDLVTQDPEDGDVDKLPRLAEQLRLLSNPTDKDILVYIFLCKADLRTLDPASRISPVLFFQPHFPNIYYSLTYKKKVATLDSEEYQRIKKSTIFRCFPYIKTFTPIRRLTTSYAATVKFMVAQTKEKREDNAIPVVGDVFVERALNRSFMLDPQDRLFQDSVMVRFEDGKLNPKATFTALAEFLDLPYDESLTYCSESGKKNPHADVEGWYAGFDLTGVYKTYDEYVGTPERCLLEYLMRDVYEYCGYDFNYYDGGPMEPDQVWALLDQFEVQDRYVRESWQRLYDFQVDSDLRVELDGETVAVTDKQARKEALLQDRMERLRQGRRTIVETLMKNLRFVNKAGQLLRMMPMLKLDPALLEQPLYH